MDQLVKMFVADMAQISGNLVTKIEVYSTLYMSL